MAWRWSSSGCAVHLCDFAAGFSFFLVTSLPLLSGYGDFIPPKNFYLSPIAKASPIAQPPNALYGPQIRRIYLFIVVFPARNWF
jgi:hypothetical protein